jgi:hypothetical protein
MHATMCAQQPTTMTMTWSMDGYSESAHRHLGCSTFASMAAMQRQPWAILRQLA